jgi:hypothetical protein
VLEGEPGTSRALMQQVYDALDARREVNFLVYVVSPRYTTIDVQAPTSARPFHRLNGFSAGGSYDFGGGATDDWAARIESAAASAGAQVVLATDPRVRGGCRARSQVPCLGGHGTFLNRSLTTRPIRLGP